MMNTTHTKKICTLCGESCEGQPRTRDARGRYYHTDCYDRAVRRQQAKRTTHPSSAPRLDESLVLNELDDHAGIPPVKAPTGTCHGCGEPVPPDAVICTNCGLNLRTGRSLVTRRGKPVRTRRRVHVGHLLVGFGSVILGAGGLLLHAASVVNTETSPGQSPAFNAGHTVGQNLGNILVAILLLWLLLAGFGVILHRPQAVVWLRRWAITKLVIIGANLTCLLAAFLAGAPALADLPEQLNPAAMGVGLAIFVTGILIAFLWTIGWPLIVLSWSGSSSTYRQVMAWN